MSYHRASTPSAEAFTERATRILSKKDNFKTFKEFYPYYLQEHSNRTNRRLHVIGTSLSITILLFIILTNQLKLLFLVPIVGYGFAWVGHFFFEKNRPATFTYPIWSLLGDFVMLYEIASGQKPF